MLAATPLTTIYLGFLEISKAATWIKTLVLTAPRRGSRPMVTLKTLKHPTKGVKNQGNCFKSGIHNPVKHLRKSFL